MGPSLFNWITSYHTRSQIHIPYGHIIGDRFPESETKTKNWAAGKTGLAIWISSNCVTTTWPMTRFVSSLRRFMKIDTFGLCGVKQCPGDQASCLKLIKSYKIYLALENSHCDQYITEKTWRNALKHDSVAIVYGAPKSDYERLAPRNSFIHIRDFSNISSLAAYIDRIDRNNSMYDEFFAWRGEQVIVEEDEGVVFKEQHLCSISRMIKDSKTGRGDDVSWFKNTCRHIPKPTNV